MKSSLKKIRFLAFVSVLIVTKVFSQTDTSFWFAAPDLLANYGDKPVYLRIASAGAQAEVKISMPANPAFATITENVNAGQTRVVDLTAYLEQIENTAVNTVANKGLLITSSSPITCYYDVANQLNGDLFVLKGSSALGNQFTVPFQRTLNPSPDWNGNTNDFILVATENNTSIEITPTNDLIGFNKSQPFMVNLNRGETYVCRARSNEGINNPGGTLVKSNKPVAVTIKEETLEYPPLICADAAGDQLIPDRLAGDEFILSKGFFANGSNPDYFYIYAIENETDIIINGTTVGKIDAGQYYMSTLRDPSAYIKTGKPSHLLHVTGFGCEISSAVVPSLKCTGTNSVKFSKPALSSDRFYLIIIAPKEIIGDFKLNGDNSLIESILFEPVRGNANWNYTRISIHQTNIRSDNIVSVENKSGKFHAAIITGSGFETSGYGYFTDFGSNTITLTNPTDPAEVLGNQKTICYNSTLRIEGKNEDATQFKWTGPNGYSFNGRELTLNAFNTNQVGTYTLTTSSTGCKEVSKSIILQLDKPEVDFGFKTNGCAEEGVSFATTTTNGEKWLWNFGNGTTLETNDPAPNNIIIGKSGTTSISVTARSAKGCLSDPKTKSIILSSKPKASFTSSAATCINEEIIFSDASTIQNGNIIAWRWNLDDGRGFQSFASNAAQKATYNALGKKDVRLVVESSTGCTSDTFRIAGGMTIHPKPLAGFIVPEVCLDDANALFQDTSKMSDGFAGFTYQWDFNAGPNPVLPGPSFDVASTKEKNPAIKYRKEADYRVKLIVNARGCLDSVTSTIRVNGVNPTPAFEVIKADALCSDDSVRIENKSSVPVFGDITRVEIYWDQNDLSKKTTDENPFPGKKYAHQYDQFNAPSTKKYTILFKAFSGNTASCSNSISKEIELKAKPKLVFDLLQGVCLNEPKKQITQARNEPLVPGSFRFKGPGMQATGEFDPSLAGTGKHTITYVYETPNGVCKDSISNTITVFALPSASFTASETACEKNSVVFTSTSTAPAGASLVAWKWNPGDGTNTSVQSNGNPVTHTYTAIQTYTPTLVVESNQGCSSSPFSKPIEVKPLPVPAFTLPAVCLPAARALFENKTTIADASVMTFRWDFGDALDRSPSLTKDGSHTYLALGTYPVTLIASSAFGCVDSVTQNFSEIYPQPKAGFSSVDSACLGTPLRFEDTSKTAHSTISEWFWELGDKTKESQKTFAYTYSLSGIYKVTLYAKTALGCVSDTVSKNIEIIDFPVVNAGPDLFVLDDGQKPMQSTARGNDLKFRWSPSDFLSDSTVLSPVIIKPQEDRKYTFFVTGRGNCSNSDEVLIKVLKLPKPPNTFTPNGDGINDTWEIPYLDQYTESVLEIYTTAGQLIHRSVGYPRQWDGKSGGGTVPSGTYYYVIDPRNGRKKISGYVTVIR